MRRHIPFEALWQMPIKVPYSLLVRDGDLAWTCGQLALDGDSNVLAPGDLIAQTRVVCGYISDVVARGGLGGDAICKLVMYHTAGSANLRDNMLSVAREHFGDTPLVVPVAVPHFYYDGLQIEVDAFASAKRGAGSVSESAGGGVTLKLVDGGELVWASLEISPPKSGLLPPVDASFSTRALAEFGVAPGQLIAEHWFVPSAFAADFTTGETAALLRNEGLLAAPGAVVMTGPGDTRIIAELSFARGGQSVATTSVEASGVAVTCRRGGRFLWLCGHHTNRDINLVEQTSQIMDALGDAMRARSVCFADVIKSNTHYVGANTADALHDNMAVRNARYEQPGPASTGLPVFGLADAGALTAIDVLLTVRN